MRIHLEIRFVWDESRKEYVKVFDNFYEYNGPVELLCGASSQQKQIEASQQQFYDQMTQQAQQVFGKSSQVFQSLQDTFAPIVAAGPSQKGFSDQELANLNSQAITQTGIAYKNAKAAAGNAIAATGGGTGLPSGFASGLEANLAENAANQTSNELSQITQANYETGRQNYENAVKGMEGSTEVFNPSSTFSNSTTNAGSAAASTANQITQANNSWVNATIGALGGIAGGFATGGLNTIMSGAKAASGAFNTLAPTDTGASAIG